MSEALPSGPVAQNGASAGTTLTIPNPYLIPGAPAFVEGDYLLGVIRAQGTVATAITADPAFTRSGAANGAADRAQGIFHSKVTPAIAARTDFTFGGWSSGRSVGEIQVFKNIDPDNPVAGTTLYSTTNLAEYEVGATPFTTIVAWGDERTAGRSKNPASTPEGYSQLASVQSDLGEGTAGSRTAIWAGYRAVGDSGSTVIPAASLTWPDGQSASRAVSATFRAIPSPITPPAGFRSVSLMLATAGATWAHRGGSLNWPEMSEYAYYEAALRGYGVLEFSAQRSLDGWWFGLHDNDFNRTSQTTGSPAPGTLTRAQIESTYQNTLRSSGTPRPYWGLIDFLDRWTPTHVVVVDPKNQLGYINEFLNILDAHGGKDKIIVKYSGTGAGSANLADLAADREYKTWGYFYEADMANGNINTWQSHWSILGMEYGASQEVWDYIKSFGKPVVAHIAPNQAAYDTGIAKGARMVQVSSPATVTAVGAPASAFNQPWASVHIGSATADRVYVGSEQVWP